MVYSQFRIFRIVNVIKGEYADHILQAKARVAEARQALKDIPLVDTFVGRKTQEPFPKEKEE